MNVLYDSGIVALSAGNATRRRRGTTCEAHSRSCASTASTHFAVSPGVGVGSHTGRAPHFNRNPLGMCRRDLDLRPAACDGASCSTQSHAESIGRSPRGSEPGGNWRGAFRGAGYGGTPLLGLGRKGDRATDRPAPASPWPRQGHNGCLLSIGSRACWYGSTERSGSVDALGRFRSVTEESSSAGVRRVRVVLEP
jgi:hypothetical protein